MISKNFNPESADKVFENEDTEEGVEWLADLISFYPWRHLIYQVHFNLIIVKLHKF